MFAASNNFRRNTLDAALDLSFGMPFDLQLEFGLPDSWVDQSSVTTVGGQSRQANSEHGSGWATSASAPPRPCCATRAGSPI